MAIVLPHVDHDMISNERCESNFNKLYTEFIKTVIHTSLLLELQSNLTFSSLFKPLLLSVSEDTVVIFILLAYLLLFCVFCYLHVLQ